ncbi:FHA modulated ABC efflux pump with fused ATPase and integral membrane subunits [Oscillochloris trichoides DG-6]|uniref:FHA modulated ABC efflux pump with fused ATPase and integral membrane subunits n=1 Tax=Oscillochloris trichoides DG-6 TaxID=765420 RepID=E1IH73_9CHLR|nr:FHA domain-containing protein [Oscillochloris trichoides]EFO79548.1 FHA modulated ABC efflux pump with fused ATPase and integral membrane subunits [Oscillochloris trichoides DG-6]
MATIGLGAVLQVQEEGQIRTLPLTPAPITLGRAPDNDLVFASRFVSGHHARIEPLGPGHRILDVGSTNGLLFEGRRVTSHDLCDGDVLRIGDPATGSFVTLTYRNGDVLRTPQANTLAQRYPLDPNDPQITIGRAGCDIVLENPQVSRFHAQIDRTAAGAILRDAGSTNGTFVNGQRLSAAHTLRAGDVIQIGSFKLIYNVQSLDQYDQQGALRIDARNLNRIVARGGQQRTILHDVSLSIAPREFVALVGGSGTGKSTLMKALCGYVPANAGQVLVNGDDFYRNFDAYRTVLGYVPQDDILHRTLPVNRALGYAARLRLPADTAENEIDARITRVLEDVEMSPHRDKMVENLSGGQRKRVSIAAELLADPSLFFLDEPTSGLDPGLEKKMMYTLRRLADSGRTVVLVTHATANITQCDHVVFMAAGRMVYFGPPSEALNFFQVTGGDFADIYTKLEGQADPQNPIVQRDLQAEYQAWSTANPGLKESPSLAELWERKYRASPIYQRYVADRLGQSAPVPVAVPAAAAPSKNRVSPLRQFGILARRYFDLTLQDRRNLLILLLQAPIIALLLLLVARSDALTGAQAVDLLQRGEAKKVLFMLATVSVWFGIINAAREITKELPIFQRERLVNLRIGPYLLSKVAVLSALIVLQTLVMLGLVALKVHFPADTGLFLPPLVETFITLLLTALTGMSLGLVISAASDSGDRAISIVPLALIPQILFAGLIFKIEGLATPLSWLTISRWAMDALGMSVDLNSLCNLPNTDSTGSVPPGCSPGFLDVEASFTHTPAALLGRWAAMLLYSLICIAITAWLLHRRDRQI